jgi:hypothetical protein
VSAHSRRRFGRFAFERDSFSRANLKDVLGDAQDLLQELGIHFEAGANEASAAAMLSASINYPMKPRVEEICGSLPTAIGVAAREAALADDDGIALDNALLR